MAEMSMNKVIHGAFRRDLDRFSDALTTFRPGDTERAEGLERAWDNFDHQLVDHHEGEHEIAWPALVTIGVSQAVIDQMDEEHATMAAALAHARTTMHALPAKPDEQGRQESLAAIERLREVTGTHLDHEERELESLYLEQQDSAAVKEMGRKFARRNGPSQGGVFFAWVLDGCSPEERAALESNAPKPVIAILTTLFGRSYRKNVAPVWAG